MLHPNLSAKKLLLSLLVLFVFSAIVALTLISAVYLSTKRQQFFDSKDLPENRVGIVFGAYVRPDRTLTPILKDRVDGAINLYKEKKILKILMSGDNSQVDYNEVVAMQEYAIGQGVPETDIALDYAGFSTYDSCYRAKAIFGLSKATLITQSYHLPRALFTCKALGVEAVGYALPDFTIYPDLRLPYSLREYAADLKAWWEIYIAKSEPKFLGKYEAIP